MRSAVVALFLGAMLIFLLSVTSVTVTALLEVVSIYPQYGISALIFIWVVFSWWIHSQHGKNL